MFELFSNCANAPLKLIWIWYLIYLNVWYDGCVCCIGLWTVLFLYLEIDDSYVCLPDWLIFIYSKFNELGEELKERKKHLRLNMDLIAFPTTWMSFYDFCRIFLSIRNWTWNLLISQNLFIFERLISCWA